MLSVTHRLWPCFARPQREERAALAALLEAQTAQLNDRIAALAAAQRQVQAAKDRASAVRAAGPADAEADGVPGADGADGEAGERLADQQRQLAAAAAAAEASEAAHRQQVAALQAEAAAARQRQAAQLAELQGVCGDLLQQVVDVNKRAEAAEQKVRAVMLGCACIVLYSLAAEPTHRSAPRRAPACEYHDNLHRRLSFLSWLIPRTHHTDVLVPSRPVAAVLRGSGRAAGPGGGALGGGGQGGRPGLARQRGHQPRQGAHGTSAGASARRWRSASCMPWY